MTYSVYQHWDPLKVMAVGKSYPPELYNYIKNEKVRKVFYQIAEETEEDYQKLISLLKSFGVETVRPDMEPDIEKSKWNIKNNKTLTEQAIIIIKNRDTPVENLKFITFNNSLIPSPFLIKQRLLGVVHRSRLVAIQKKFLLILTQLLLIH